MIKKNKQKQSISRVFVNFEKKNINDIINNSSKRRKQFIEIDFNNFTKFFIFHIRRNFFDVFMLLRKSTTLIDDKNEFFQKRNRLKKMKLNNHDRKYMKNRENARWSNIKNFDDFCIYETFFDWIQFVEIKLEINVCMFFTIKLQINYVVFHCTKTIKKLIKKRIQRNNFNFFKSINDLCKTLTLSRFWQRLFLTIAMTIRERTLIAWQWYHALKSTWRSNNEASL